MINVKINGMTYPAKIAGSISDRNWDNRASKTITLSMSYEEAMALFVDEVPWSIVESCEVAAPQTDENGNLLYDGNGNVLVETVTEETEYDNSEYCVAGSVTDHRNGTVSVKMGKPTDAEILAIIMGGK